MLLVASLKGTFKPGFVPQNFSLLDVYKCTRVPPAAHKWNKDQDPNEAVAAAIYCAATQRIVKLPKKSSDFLFRHTCAWYLVLPKLFSAKVFCHSFFLKIRKRQNHKLISDFFLHNFFLDSSSRWSSFHSARCNVFDLTHVIINRF